MPRSKGVPKTGGRPATSRPYTCPVCGKEFVQPASSRTAAAAYCSRRCAAIARERALDHEPAIVAKCGLDGCETIVKRYVSKGSKVFSGNVYCCRNHANKAKSKRLGV